MRCYDDGPDEGVGPERPIDLAALQADDALIEALAAGRIRPGDRTEHATAVDDELVAMLAAWVAEVRPQTPDRLAPAPPEPVTEPLAVPVTNPPRSLLRGQLMRRLTAAAALVLLAAASLLAGAGGAVPGDPLWEISKVWYTERAKSVEAAVLVTTGLETARTAMREGRRAEAERAIAETAAVLDDVRPDEGRDQLVREQEILITELAASDAAAPSASSGPTAGGGPSDADPATGPPTPAAGGDVLAAPTGPADGSARSPDIVVAAPPGEQPPPAGGASPNGAPTEIGSTPTEPPPLGPVQIVAPPIDPTSTQSAPTQPDPTSTDPTPTPTPTGDPTGTGEVPTPAPGPGEPTLPPRPGVPPADTPPAATTQPASTTESDVVRPTRSER